jgi:serine/threonine protein phosphatase PrpC
VVAAACPACATADAIGADGYCTHCGILAVRPRDHIELTVDNAGAVTDRGRRHHRNEDAVWIAARGADVDLVVCDGVSSSFDPDAASAVAAETAGRLLAKTGSAADDVLAEIGAAIVAAGADVAALAAAGDPRRVAANPACTIVAACVRGAAIGYGWVGDSRAYWIPAAGPAVQLTEDDSWAAHAIRDGMAPAQALTDAKAHAITAWLGADAGDIEPRTGRFVPDAPGHLLLCSDGLWNYLTDHAHFADTVRAHLAAGDLVVAARGLTGFANDAGGSDNITVALTPVAPPAG